MRLKNESAATTPPIRQVFHGVKKPELVFRHGGKPVVRFPGSWKRAVWGLAVGLLPVFQAAASKPPENAVYGSQRNYGQSGTVGDPISAASGAFSWSKTLFDLGGPMGLHFTLTYRTDPALFLQRTPGDFPPDFDSWMDVPIVWSWSPAPIVYDAGVNAFRVFTDDGTHLSFQTNAAGTLEFVLVDGYGQKQSVTRNYQLKKQDGWLCFCDPVREHVTLLRNATGTLYRPEYVLDRNTNRLVYLYDSDSHNNPRDIEDNEGRELHLAYVWYDFDGNMNFKQRLVEVVDQATRSWSFHYETNAIDNNGRVTLRAIVGPDGQTNRFRYTPNHFVGEPGDITTNLSLLESVIEPMGNFTFSNEYAHISLDGDTPANVRVCAQADAYGNKTVLSMNYVGGEYLGTVTNADGSTEQFAHERHHDVPPSSIRDESGSTMSFGINSNALLTTVTDRLDGVTFFGYDASGRRLETVTNAAGHVLRFTYETVEQTFLNPATNQSVTFEFDQLTRIDFPDGTFETFAYDGRGNVTSRTDRAGHAWTTTYDDRGRILSERNPLGGLTTYAYTSNGLLQSVTNSDGFSESYGYDAYFRLTSITHADGTTQRYAYDKMDRLIATVNELNQTNSITYDANGRLVAVTDPLGHSITYERDLMNRVTGTVNRAGGRTASTFNNRGNLATRLDPDGLLYTYSYDLHGRMTNVASAGASQSLAYNAEGVPEAVETAAGLDILYSADALGRFTSISNSHGAAVHFERDSEGRVIARTDPLSRRTTYAYDPEGRIAAITNPAGHSATYAYDDAGNLASIRGLGSHLWTFSNSPHGLLLATTDPLGQTTRRAYDARGQLVAITNADATTETRFYDPAGNLTNVHYSSFVIDHLAFSYDPAGRLTDADGVHFDYDPSGNITNTVQASFFSSATYDTAMRLTHAGYANNAFAVEYTYDPANARLASVRDTLTGHGVAFTYDNAGRLTQIARTNGVHDTITYDSLSRVTRIQTPPHLDLTYAYDRAGQATQTIATLPLAPSSSLAPQTTSLSFDAASQISTLGYEYDPCGRLTTAPWGILAWDAAHRLTAISNSSFSPHPSSFSYNGLGDLIRRDSDGQTNHLIRHYAIGDGRVVSEHNGAAYTRHYVWTPDGRLLYLIDVADGNKIQYYHFDNAGNTLALTDPTGGVSAAYAHDPFGNLLAQTGASDQPYTFAGAHGLRREGTNGLYYVRARWYHAKTQRFLTREPLWPILANPVLLNPYQYAFGNPILFADANGLSVMINDVTKFTPMPLSERNYHARMDIEDRIRMAQWEQERFRHIRQKWEKEKKFGCFTTDLLEEMTGENEIGEKVMKWAGFFLKRNRVRKAFANIPNPRSKWVGLIVNILDDERTDEQRRADLNVIMDAMGPAVKWNGEDYNGFGLALLSELESDLITGGISADVDTELYRYFMDLIKSE